MKGKLQSYNYPSKFKRNVKKLSTFQYNWVIERLKPKRNPNTFATKPKCNLHCYRYLLLIRSQSELAVTQFGLIEYLLPVGYYKPQVLPAPRQVIELTTVSGREATGPTMKGPSGNVDEELPNHPFAALRPHLGSTWSFLGLPSSILDLRFASYSSPFTFRTFVSHFRPLSPFRVVRRTKRTVSDRYS